MHLAVALFLSVGMQGTNQYHDLNPFFSAIATTVAIFTSSNWVLKFICYKKLEQTYVVTHACNRLLPDSPLGSPSLILHHPFWGPKNKLGNLDHHPISAISMVDTLTYLQPPTRSSLVYSRPLYPHFRWLNPNISWSNKHQFPWNKIKWLFLCPSPNKEGVFIPFSSVH